MNEEEARAWVKGRFGRQEVALLERFVTSVLHETKRQNLIARSTVELIWSRHVVDSAQLIDLNSYGDGTWLDIGTGGGFPGIVVALLVEQPMILCEPRPLRVRFLRDLIGDLGLSSRVSVAPCKVEGLSEKVSTISARAVAPVKALIQAAQQCSLRDTCWILPRGRSIDAAISDVPEGAMFHVEHSISDPGAGILVMQGII